MSTKMQTVYSRYTRFFTPTIFLVLIVILGVIVRFYNLSGNPPGLYVDEQSIGYNAYSILKTGRDEHGVFLPLEFKAFGEYKLPVYIYLTTLSIAVFGPIDFAVRFPSAFFAVLTILVSFFLVNDLFPSKNKLYGLLTAFFVATSPWHIHFSRAGFEATVALFFITTGVFLVLKEKPIWKVSGLVSLIIAIYTYNAARIFVPLMLVGLVFWYFRQHKKLPPKTIRYGILFFVLLLPFFFTLFSGTALIRSTQTSAFSESQRRFPTSSPAISHGFAFLSNVSSYFAPSFLFFSSDGNGRHSVVEMGNLYLFQLPLVLAGIIFLVQKKYKHGTLLGWWVLLAALSASLFRPSPHALRSLFMVIPLQVFCVIGIVGLYQKARIFRRIASYVYVGGLLFFIAYGFASYLHLYWVHYGRNHALDWGGGHKALFSYLETVSENYEHITITNWWGQPYIAALWYLHFDPATYHMRDKNKNSFGKYTFGETAVVTEGKKSLLVYPPNLSPGGNKIKSIYLPNNDVVFEIWEF